MSRSNRLLSPAAGYEAPHPVRADIINAIYFRPATGNLILVGLSDSAEADAMLDPDGYFEGVDDNFVLEAGEGSIKRHGRFAENDHVYGQYEYSIVG